VPDGGALCVHGDSAAPVRALLLALAGRVAPDAGAVKVTGLVLPERASTVRGRVAVVDAAAEGGAVGAVVDTAVRDGARMVVVDRTDVVVDRDTREALAGALARVRRVGVAVVLGATGVAATDLVPDGTPVLDVGGGWGAPVSLVGGEVPPPVPDGHAPSPDVAAEPRPTHDQHDASTQEVRA
jgi:RND superfamily putative drug exporter